MTPYEQLRAKCNELLPDRLKLEFGCEVERYNHLEETRVWKDGFLRTEHVHDGIREVFCGQFAEDIALVRIDEKIGAWMPFEVPRYLARDWKILGKPLTIEDVLRALRGLYSIAGDGALLYVSREKYEHVRDEHSRVFFDLTKPLSAPENEAACTAVLTLLV